MTGKGFRLATAILLGLLLISTTGCSAAQAEETPLYVIERDTLQTRNFVPIINHETMVVNLGEAGLSLQLASPVPAGKNRTGPFYPAFLEDSLLPDPLFSPLEVAPEKVSYLDRPQLVEKEGAHAFVWKQVDLPAREATIAQYDNYLGEPDFYRRPAGLDIYGLKINSRYQAIELQNGRWELAFTYTLANSTASDISDLSLEIFLPLTRHSEDDEDETGSVLLSPDQICSSPNLEVARMTRADGFGRPAAGLSALLRIEALSAGEQRSFFIKVSGRREERTGTLWPILSLRGRSLQAPVWPPTRIEAVPSAKEGRFSYLSYNLVLQDSRVLELSPAGFRVETAPPFRL
jgi:hypothetical protein